jgi:predicted TIM-barrel fold metal-dependent hydrolase
VPHLEHQPDGDFWVTPGSTFPALKAREMDPAWYDAKARLEALDQDGVDAEVLYPNSGPEFANAAADPEFHLAMVQLYNDFLSDFCAVAPDRFGGCALLPEIGIDAALAEMERLQDRPGIIAWLLKAYPHGDTILSDADDAVWEAIVASGKPATMHIGLRGETAAILRSPLPGTLHFNDAPYRMLEIIFSGVLDRFPTLIFFLAEIDCGWLPYFSQTADDNYLRRTRQEMHDAWETKVLPRLPSEYMKARFPASFITDPFAVRNRHAVGVERMLWSSDFPHPTTDWPFSWKSIFTTFSDVPDDERHAILAGNAQRVFGFGRTA